jgi:hypothetical protein
MKLVLRYLMLHYFIRVLFVLTFRLASMALAYPLSVSNNTLQDSEGLVRRMNVQFSSCAHPIYDR